MQKTKGHRRPLTPEQQKARADLQASNQFLYGHRKHDEDYSTPESRELEKLFRKYSESYSRVPEKWAPVVLKRLKEIEKRFGFQRPANVLQGTIGDTSILHDLTAGIFKLHKRSYKIYPEWGFARGLARLGRIIAAWLHNQNPMNQKIRLLQIKEKFGKLTIYAAYPDKMLDYEKTSAARCFFGIQSQLLADGLIYKAYAKEVSEELQQIVEDKKWNDPPHMAPIVPKFTTRGTSQNETRH